MGYLSPVPTGPNRAILDSITESLTTQRLIPLRLSSVAPLVKNLTTYSIPCHPYSSPRVPSVVVTYDFITPHGSPTPIFNQTIVINVLQKQNLPMRLGKRLCLKRLIDGSELQWCGGLGMLQVQRLITSSLASLRPLNNHSLPISVSELITCN